VLIEAGFPREAIATCISRTAAGQPSVCAWMTLAWPGDSGSGLAPEMLAHEGRRIVSGRAKVRI